MDLIKQKYHILNLDKAKIKGYYPIDGAEDATKKIMKPINLKEHPEGNRFLEVFRSAKTISTSKENLRSALTHIYFSLKPDERSKRGNSGDMILNSNKKSG